MLTVKGCKKSKVIVMFILIISILTSCGNNVDTLEDFDAEEELEPAELTFYLLGNEPADKDEVLKEIENKCGLNVKLDFQWFEAKEYFNKVNTALASNEKLDAFVCGATMPQLDIHKLTREGEVKDLTKLLPEYAPKIYSQLSKEKINMLKMDNKITVVPSSLNSLRGISVYVNKELADKYNIENVNTFEDYDKVLKTMNENEKAYIPGFFSEFNINSFFDCAYNYIVLDRDNNLVYKWDDPNIKVIPLEQIPEFKENISLLIDWFNIIDLDYPDKEEKIATRLNFNRVWNEDKVQKVDGTKYYYYNLFKGNKLQRVSDVNNMVDSSFAFNINSQNVERALMFLNWIQSSRENYNLVNYGIEGKHFIFDDDGLFQVQPEYRYWRNNPFKNYRYEFNNTQELNELEKYIEDNTEYAPHEGFYPDYSNMEKELANRQSLFNLYISSKVIQGTYDVSKTDEIIEKLRKTGTDKIVLEVQKQLDNWKKNNK